MALFDKENRRLLLGIGLGAGAAWTMPFVGPVLVAIARPLTKALMNQGILGFEKASEQLAHVAESLQDLLAEVRAEQQAAPTAAAASEAIRPTGPDHGAN